MIWWRGFRWDRHSCLSHLISCCQTYDWWWGFSWDRQECLSHSLLAACSCFTRGDGFVAGVAIAADFSACNRDLDLEFPFDLFLHLFVKRALEFAHLPAFQAGNVDVFARAMTLVVVPVAADMQQVQLVNQAVGLEQVNGAVNGYGVDAGIDLARAGEDFRGVQVPLRGIHHFQDHQALARQAD